MTAYQIQLKIDHFQQQHQQTAAHLLKLEGAIAGLREILGEECAALAAQEQLEAAEEKEAAEKAAAAEEDAAELSAMAAEVDAELSAIAAEKVAAEEPEDTEAPL